MGRIIKEPIIEETYSSKNLPLPTGRQADPSFPKRGNSSLYEREEYPPPLIKGDRGGFSWFAPGIEKAIIS